MAGDDESNFFDATWSPDNSQIAYVKSKSVEVGSVQNTHDNLMGETSVWVMNFDGTNPRLISLIHSNTHSLADNVNCYRESFIRTGLNWSSDGKYLHYTYLGNQDGTRGHYHYVMNVKTGKEFFAFKGQYGNFVWSPSGTKFAFLEAETPKVYDIETGDIVELPLMPKLQETWKSLDLVWAADSNYPALVTRSHEAKSRIYSIAENQGSLTWKESYYAEDFYIGWANKSQSRYFFAVKDDNDYLIDLKTGTKLYVDDQAEEFINVDGNPTINKVLPNWPVLTYLDPKTLEFYGLYLEDGKLVSRLIANMEREAFPKPIFFTKIDVKN